MQCGRATFIDIHDSHKTKKTHRAAWLAPPEKSAAEATCFQTIDAWQVSRRVIGVWLCANLNPSMDHVMLGRVLRQSVSTRLQPLWAECWGVMKPYVSGLKGNIRHISVTLNHLIHTAQHLQRLPSHSHNCRFNTSAGPCTRRSRAAASHSCSCHRHVGRPHPACRRSAPSVTASCDAPPHSDD